jgi:hypothetical protein
VNAKRKAGDEASRQLHQEMPEEKIRKFNQGNEKLSKRHKLERKKAEMQLLQMKIDALVKKKRSLLDPKGDGTGNGLSVDSEDSDDEGQRRRRKPVQPKATYLGASLGSTTDREDAISKEEPICAVCNQSNGPACRSRATQVAQRTEYDYGIATSQEESPACVDARWRRMAGRVAGPWRPQCGC